MGDENTKRESEEFVDPDHPEFAALLERQRRQVEELKLQQRKDRIALRQKIRNRIKAADT
jgi:hypothetical protein